MTIPPGVNHLEFYELCKSKNIKLRSRFVGVFFKLNRSGAPSWYCKVQSGINSIYHFTQVFPFSEQGEKDASEKYKSVSQKLGNRKITEKRKPKKQTQP